LDYEAFKGAVREASARADAEGHPLSIPELRRELSPYLSRTEFEPLLLRLQRDGRVHLLSHVDSGQLSPAEQIECLRHPSGLLLYWIRWLA
jgi:hypothetical protein